MSTKTTYKQTEVGLIPEDWEVKKLGNEINILGGNAFSSNDISEEGIKWLKIANVGINKIKEDVLEFLPFEFKEIHKDFLLKSGDYVMALTRPLLGGKLKISKILNNDEWLLNQRVAKLDSKVGTIEYYINYFKQPYFCYQLEVLMAGTDPPNLSLTEFKNIKIPVPPLPEQKKIADCLSTWDIAIEKQSALINALTDRKKALMQQLLTGKKRLPGFSGEWKEVKLGDIGEISSAGVDKNIVEGEKPIRLLNFLDVYRRDFLYSHEQNHWVTANDYKIEKCSIKKGDVFFTPSSEVPNDIAISAVAMENFDNVVYSYHIVRFRIKEKWDLRYKAYAFKTDEFFKQAQRICDGSGQRYVISQNNFKNIKIKIPSLEEQTAIAEILATADRELTLQKEKLAQLQTQKKGLMQVLLTGKKRLLN